MLDCLVALRAKVFLWGPRSPSIARACWGFTFYIAHASGVRIRCYIPGGYLHGLNATISSTFFVARNRSSLTALHPDSIRTLTVSVERQTVVEAWEATPGTTELQEIPGLEGLEGNYFEINGVMEAGEYFAILEVRSFKTFHLSINKEFRL